MSLCITLLPLLFGTSYTLSRDPPLLRGDACVLPDPNEPLQTCNMIDYPVFLDSSRPNLQALDQETKLYYQSFTDNVYKDDFSKTEDCANAIRGFQCTLHMPRCEIRDNVPKSLPPCQQTCDQFADICYSPESAAAFKKSTCQNFPVDECTRNHLPPPPQAFIPDANVIMNETVYVDYVGNVNFGAQDLVLSNVYFKSAIAGRDASFNVVIDAGNISLTLGYWFKELRFPWVGDSGSIQATTTAQVAILFHWDQRSDMWVPDVQYSELPLKLKVFDTGMAWLKDWLYSWWYPTVSDKLAAAILELLSDKIQELLNSLVGMFGKTHPNAELDINLEWDFTQDWTKPYTRRKPLVGLNSSTHQEL